MRRKQLNWIASWLPFFLAMLVGIAEAQTAGDTRLQIRLRNSDGTAVTGETVILQRLPEEEHITPALRQTQGDKCETNANGECTWYVGRGLYQVLFAWPLDDISALAVAEGGLRGFGVTVGDEPIAYHFTFHSDGRVYFDAAPEATMPSPIIPSLDALHSGTAPTPALNDEPVEETPAPEPTDAPDTAVDTASGKLWRIILFIGVGLALGGGLHLLRRRSEPAPSTSANSAQALSRRQVRTRKRQQRPPTQNPKSKIQNQGESDA